MYLMMGYYIVLFTAFFSYSTNQQCGQSLDNSEHVKYSRPPIEIRAILVRCVNRENVYKTIRSEKDRIAPSRNVEVLQFYGFDEDEPLLHSEITNCKKKLQVSVKFNQDGKEWNEADFLIINTAYDPVAKERVRLLYPVVLKLKQEPVGQAYQMVIDHIVNARAYEEIISKANCPHYVGCSVTDDPTCGKAYYNGKPIPYSEGFCCSCDESVNTKRQPVKFRSVAPIAGTSSLSMSGLMPQIRNPPKRRKRPKKSVLENKSVNKNGMYVNLKLSSEIVSKYLSNPQYRTRNLITNRSRVDFKQIDNFRSFIVPSRNFANNKKYINHSKRKLSTTAIISKSFRPYDKNYSQFSNNKTILISSDLRQNRVPRQISVSGVQKRGGQSCVDRYVPAWANPFTYHESAHCLRFSDLWYSVYRLKDPFIYHSVYFEIFEKNCKAYEHGWSRCTGGDIVRVGTFHRKSIDEGPNVVFTYTPFSANANKYFCFDPLLHMVMVPRMVPISLVEKYPQVSEGPGRYLLISPSGITHDGEDCDKAGVGYSAFASQPDRCNKPAGTCLNNQPLDFWEHDDVDRAQNRSGNFFLDNFACVEENSIKIAEGKQFLTVGYAGHYTSVVEIEMRLDDNIVIRNESPALIHEILIDSTCEHQTKITIKVTNTGYVSTAYRPKITNCPVNIPNIWYDNEGPLVYIAPFRVHIFRVTLYGTTRPTRFHCSVEIMNNRSETLAVRRIRIQKYDRCFCVWHCLCSCAASSQKYGCHPMSVDHYHAAGFIGSVPETDVLQSKEIAKKHFRENLSRAVIVAFNFYMLLIIIGFIKALFGSLCYPNLATKHLDILCPNFCRAAWLMPALCPCRFEIVRTSSIGSSSDVSGIADSNGKRTAGVLMLEYYFNTICYICIVGLYLIIIVFRCIKCCLLFFIPVKHNRELLYDTRSFESSFTDIYEEHERRGSCSNEELFDRFEALKDKHIPNMIHKKNRRTKMELLEEIRQDLLDIYRNASTYPNDNNGYTILTKIKSSFDIRKHLLNKDLITSKNKYKSTLGTKNRVHKKDKKKSSKQCLETNEEWCNNTNFSTRYPQQF